MLLEVAIGTMFVEIPINGPALFVPVFPLPSDIHRSVHRILVEEDARWCFERRRDEQCCLR